MSEETVTEEDLLARARALTIQMNQLIGAAVTLNPKNAKPFEFAAMKNAEFYFWFSYGLTGPAPELETPQ